MTVAKKENSGGGIAPMSGIAKFDRIAHAKEKIYESLSTFQVEKLAYGSEQQYNR
jgi:hypothetical protein